MKTSKRIQLGYEDFIGSLDKLGIQDNAVFIFSPYEKLVSSYTGYAVEVRRSSDDATMNFGFDNWGYLEVTKLLDWIGSGNSGYIKTIYNQAKQSNNIYQNINTGQPLIVDSGVFLEDGINFDGINDFMKCEKYDGINITDHPLSIFCQMKKSSASTGYIIGINTDSSNTQYSLYTTTVPQAINWKLTPTTTIQSDYNTGIQENIMAVYKDGGTNAQITRTNNDEDSGNYSSVLTEYNFLNIGCRSTSIDNSTQSFYHNGSLKKIIIFNANISDYYNDLIGKTFNIDSIYDTYVYSFTPDTNYNSNGFLNLYYGGLSDYQGVLLYFNLDALAGKSIKKAVLKLYRKLDFTGNLSSNVRYINGAWDETTVTYNLILSYIGTTQYGNITHNHGLVNTYEEWDITSLIQDIANGTITDYEGLYIFPNSLDYSSDRFYDNSDSLYKPRLNVITS